MSGRTVQSSFVMDLKPTQMAVGLAEVENKKKLLEGKTLKELQAYLDGRPIPVVRGPDDALYMIDRHHLARALLELRPPILQVPVVIVDDLSAFHGKKFWKKMEEKNYAFPYDGKGKRRDCGDIPPDITKLEDDPYRSLAGLARDAGAYAKSAAPFSEFQWAAFLRTRIAKDEIRNDFDAALRKAVRLSRTPEAAALPGYISSSLPTPPKKKPPAPRGP